MASLEPLLTQIDAQQAAILRDMAALPPEGRRWREQPASWCALDVLEHLLLAEQVVLGDVATGLDARGRARRVFRHPIAGPLNTGQALQLLSAHLRTHQRQLDRLRTAWHAHAHASA
jgi:hypothetical protein